jgi:hypothetical protein
MLMRFVFVGFCTGRVDAWDSGCEAAVSSLGHDAGSTFFGQILAIGRAVRIERIGTFNFLPATCAHISENEVTLLAALQAARSPDRLHLDRALFDLANQLEQTRLISSLTGLAGMLNKLGKGDNLDGADLLDGEAATGRVHHKFH